MKQPKRTNMKPLKPYKQSGPLTIKDVKKGEYIMIGKSIFMRGDYDRSSKKYEAIRTNDVWGNPKMVKGSTPVRIDFEY